MSLYDLVTLKTQLTEKLKVDTIVDRVLELRTEIANIRNFDGLTLTAKQQQYLDSLIEYYEKLVDQVQQPVLDSKEFLNDVTTEINTTTKQLFTNNYELERKPESVDIVRNTRKIYIQGGFEIDDSNIVKNRIAALTSWQYPALEIGCRDGEWTQYMNAADPLYVVDQFPEFLESMANRFNQQFVNRMRRYHLIDHNLTMLPAGQFGFVFSWGYFNYVSLDTMKHYLRQVMDLLRPGGTFLFTYNDGDTPQGAGMAEGMGQTYMPKSILIPLCESIGYKILNESSFSSHIHWIEIGRAGELATVKAHQVLGQIKRKGQHDRLFEPIVGDTNLGNDKIEVDNLSMDEIRDLAVRLGMGSPDIVRYGIPPDRLKEIVKERLK